MSNLNDEDIGRGRSNSQTTTRATLLREQSTKAALTRMDSGPLRQQKGPVYTSKTSVGSDA